CHYRSNVYHPLLIRWALLGAELRADNHYTSFETEDFLEPILEHYADLNCDLLVRDDSGFAKPEIFKLCEETKSQFLIRLKANMKLKRSQKVSYSTVTKETLNQEEVPWFSLHDYKAEKWKHTYCIIVKSTC